MPDTGLGRIIGVIAMVSTILFASLVRATATSALLEKFRAEREKNHQSKQGDDRQRHCATEHNRRALRKLSALEDTTNEINADLAELKGIRAEVQSLKESVEGKK